MAQGLSLKVLLQLEAKKFNNSVKSVQKGLVGLKNTITGLAGALAGGLGFNRFVNDIKDTAVKLSVAQQSLKNVSNGAAEYAQNLQFLKRISKDYGQDLITLTNSFAQYYAAAKVSRLELEELKDIYEALTRAAGAYHLSADQTNNMMIAVTQMFSKGKVTAEELRRQLGNNLPGAFNIMAVAAQAAGITTNGTTAELEDMMKKGKVLADDVLPAFAQQLNLVTQNADFDSLQSSINRFQNAWAEFVEAGGFEQMYQKIVDGFTKMLNEITANFSTFAVNVKSILMGLATIPVFNWLSKAYHAELEKIKAETAAADREIKKMAGATLKNSEAYDKFVQKRNKFYATKGAQKYLADGFQPKTVYQQQQLVKYQARAAALAKEEAVAREGLVKNAKMMGPALDASLKGHRAIRNSAGLLHKTWLGVKNLVFSVGGVIKSILPVAIVSGLMTVVTNIVGSIKAIRREEEQINNLAKNHVEEAEKLSDATTSTLARVKRLQQIATDTSKSDKERVAAIRKLNKELNRTTGGTWTIKTSVDEINTGVEKWIDNTKKLARAYAMFSKMQQLQEENITLEMQNEDLGAVTGQTKTLKGQYVPSPNGPGYYLPTKEVPTNEAVQAQKTIEKNNRVIEQNTRAIETISQKIESEGLEDPFTGNNGSGGNGGGGDGGSDADKFKGLNNPVVDALEKYNEQATALANRLKADTISIDDFNDEMKKLQNRTWETITAISGFENVLNDLEEIAKNAKTPEEQEAAENAIKVVKANMMNVKTAYFKNRDDARDEKFNELLSKLTSGKPQLGKRDTKFDYNKTGSDKFEEKAELYIKLNTDWQSFVDSINKAMAEVDFSNFTTDQLQLVKDALAQISAEAGEAAANATDMQHALQYLQINKSLIDQMKELDDAIKGTITGVADGMDRLYRSVQSLGDAFGEDIKWEGFEKFMAIINFSIQMFETLKTVIDGVKAAEEAYAAVKKTKAAQIAAANQMEAATAAEAAAAAGGAASAEGAEAVAGVPVVGPALAVAAAAAISAAILAAMSQFAKGGIVGGNSFTGDKNIVRANSGEMILTKGQQGTLFKAIQSGNLGGGNVNFVIRGADLVGAINNYNKRSRG